METKHRLIFKVLFFPIIFLLVFSFFTERVSAAQVLTNPSYTGGSTGWTLSGTGTSYTSAYYYDSAGSVFFSCQSTPLKCRRFYASQSISTTIYSGSTGTLSFGYQFGIQNMPPISENIKILDTDKRNLFAKMFSGFLFPALAQTGTMSTVIQILPPGGTYTTITTLSMTNPMTYHSPNPGGGSSSGSIDISSFLTNTGTYSIKVETSMSGDMNNKVWMLIDAWSMNISHASGPWGVTYTKNISAAGNITSPTTNPIAVNNASTSPTPTVTTNSGYTFNNYSITSGTCGGTFTASTGVCSSVTQDITIQANWTAATNTAPTITQTPYELTASTATAPTNQGSAVTFRTTATDTADSYYLVICSTNSVTAGSGGGVPTCGGTRYCVSTATASGVQASCSYTTVSGNAWSNAWYAFVCDNNSTNPLCSTASQGSGDSGSPFYVNHPPSFTASAVSAAINPGGSISWTTTSSDPDGQRVRLYVCKTPFFSSSSCTGGSWCESGMTLFYSNPTCTYQTNSPYPDGSYNAYPYIVDSFNLASTGTAQGVNKAFTVNNLAPYIDFDAISLNGDNPISLTESTTTNVDIKAVVKDPNGCRNQGNTADEISSVKGYLYRSGVSYTGCDTSGEANHNFCYPEITCSAGFCIDSIVFSDEGGFGVTTYQCTAGVAYFADSTDTSSLYPTQRWGATVKATDDDSVVATGVHLGVELNSLLGGSTTPTTLNFGSLAIGQSNDPLDKTLTTTPTGNVGMDILIKANTASLCTDYPTCSTTGKTPIPSSAIKYALVSSTAYASGTAVSTTNAEAELNVPKQTSSTPPSKSTWWGIAIPTGTLPGVYNGLNVITYTLGETVDW